jgi:predicted ribonuclease YlaK
MVQTERYWRIRAIDAATVRPSPLVDAETTLQHEALEQLVVELQERVRRLSRAPGQITVLDTNVLLHYQEPAKVDWVSVLGVATVRLVIPLRVVEELDAKKYAPNDKLAARARALLPQLERLVGPAGAPAELRDGVTIEVPVDTGRRDRPADADAEILETCLELARLTDQRVILVTADTAMRLRARAQSTSVEALPEGYLRVRSES